jgi:hypothetical protein
MPSNRDASASSKSKAKENFCLSEGKNNKKRRSSNVPSSSHSCKSGPTKHCNLDIDLDWDDTFKDAVITDIEVEDLESGI